jgi:hypothetical protein
MWSWQLLLVIDVLIVALGIFIAPIFLWVALVLMVVWMVVFIRARPWR